MSQRIGRPTFAPAPPTPASSTRETATRPSGERTSVAKGVVDQFESSTLKKGPSSALPASLLSGTSATAPTAAYRSLMESVQPAVHAATGYEAYFGTGVGGRKATAFVEGQGQVALPTGPGRGPSFHAEAGKPLTVKLDPSRVSSSAQQVELVWRLVPGGTEQVVPLSDGTRDPSTGKLNVSPGTIHVPEDASGLLRLSFRTTDASGRVSSQWDPSNDASIAPRERATLAFTEDWKTQLEGTLRAGDGFQLAYDMDRLSSMFGGKVPSEAVACISFNGEPPVEVPLTVQPGEGGRPGTMFMPALRVPFEATEMSLWFKGKDGENTAWDSSNGQNFKFKVGTTRDDADPSWKAELLRSKSFPNLSEDKFVGIGPSSQRYNCIAWTLGVRDEWVWPGTRVEDFDALYAKQGYKPLSEVDLSHDPNMEKVVVYGHPPKDGKGAIEVTHGALMDEQGRLTSKIGTQPLIRHDSADDLTGPSYGQPVRVYVRPREPVSVS